MPEYTDIGFSNLFEKEVPASNDPSTLDLDAQIETLSGEKVRGGTMSSNDGRTQLGLDSGTYVVNDGVQERLRLGQMEDGSYGIRIKDKDGNVLMNITGDNNQIQSASAKMQIDLSAEQLRFYDETNLRIIIGKALGVF
jgi:hypothetical protein